MVVTWVPYSSLGIILNQVLNQVLGRTFSLGPLLGSLAGLIVSQVEYSLWFSYGFTFGVSRQIFTWVLAPVLGRLEVSLMVIKNCFCLGIGSRTCTVSWTDFHSICGRIITWALGQIFSAWGLARGLPCAFGRIFTWGLGRILIKGKIGEIYSLLTFGFQITTRKIFYFYIYSPFCDQSQCHT
jgi:hypothetical protein